MVCVTDALHGSLINGGEALAGGPVLEEGLGSVNAIIAGLPSKDGSLSTIQIGAPCWFLGETIEEATLMFALDSSWEQGAGSSGFSLGTHTMFLVTWVTLFSLWLRITCLVNEKGSLGSS